MRLVLLFLVALSAFAADPSGSCTPGTAPILNMADSLLFVCQGGTWTQYTVGSSGNSTSIQGRSVAATAPSDGNALIWSTSNSQWQPGAAAGGSATWGSITGTLSNQTDLQTALNGKQSTLTLPLSVANGGNGTGSPGIQAGSNVSVTGSWPTQTIAVPNLYNQTIENAGTPVTQRAKLSLAGSNGITVTPTDNGTDTSTFTFGISGYQASGNYLTTIQENGTSETQEPKLNLIPGSNVTITCADNSSATSTDCTFAASGSGGMVYPGAGIANSTGTAWGTSYTTSGTGTTLASAAGATLTGATVDSVSPTTFGYLDATSSIQTQLNAKAPTVAPTFTVATDSTSLALTADHLTLSSSSSPSIDVVNTAGGGHHFQFLFGLGTLSLYDQTGTDTPFYIYNAGSSPSVATNANGSFGWSSNTQYADQGTIDTYLTRLAAGSIGVNGTAILIDPGLNGIVQRTAAGVTSVATTTGTGSLVQATSPTLTTPTLGAATATTINKVTITGPATSATLTIANGKTLTANNSITFAGTDGTTMTMPSSSATITQTIASGTATLGTSAIASGACATVVTATATGTATTDVISTSFNGDPTSVTGYGASATGAVLTIYPYPTANTANFKVCNSTASSITPGALTLNWRVTR